MKKSQQIRRPSKKDVPQAELQSRSDMNTLAKGGDKESNEPLRKQLKSSGPSTSASRKPSR